MEFFLFMIKILVKFAKFQPTLLNTKFLVFPIKFIIVKFTLLDLMKMIVLLSVQF